MYNSMIQLQSDTKNNSIEVYFILRFFSSNYWLYMTFKKYYYASITALYNITM